MSFCCSECNFTSNFESALTMHRQLHHEASNSDRRPRSSINTFPRQSHSDQPFSITKENKGMKLLARTSSATRLFDKLRTRICKSKMLFSHPEETVDGVQNAVTLQSGSSKMYDTRTVETPRQTQNETFGCHLCSFDADRITVLDRHLLNDHKIGLDNLLKLVMAKTKDGLSEGNSNPLYGIRQPYYKPPDEIIEQDEFVIETVAPEIKVLKHASVNTDLKWTDIPNLEDCKNISKEIEDIIDVPIDGTDNGRLLTKMQTLNEYMSKFVNSSNTLNKVLTKEFSHKNPTGRPYFDLGLGESDKRVSSDSFYF